MNMRPTSKNATHCAATRTEKVEASLQASPIGCLKTIADRFQKFFTWKKKADASSDLMLGDQVKLPKEFLESIAQLPSTDKGN